MDTSTLVPESTHWITPGRRKRPVWESIWDIGTICGFLFWIALDWRGHRIEEALVLAPLIALRATYQLRQLNENRRAAEQMLEDPQDMDVCLVQIDIRVDKRAVGTDVGLAWFDQHGLFFSGRRCSFIVGGQDLISLNEIGWDHRLEDSLLLRHPTQRVEVKMTPIESESRNQAALNFGKRRRRFLQDAPASNVNRQYPPLEPPARKREILPL